MSMFKMKKKIGKCMVEVEDEEGDAPDYAGSDEELEEDEDGEDGDTPLGDEIHDEEDEIFIESIEITPKNMRRFNIVPVSDTNWKEARSALRKVRFWIFLMILATDTTSLGHKAL